MMLGGYDQLGSSFPSHRWVIRGDPRGEEPAARCTFNSLRFRSSGRSSDSGDNPVSSGKITTHLGLESGLNYGLIVLKGTFESRSFKAYERGKPNAMSKSAIQS